MGRLEANSISVESQDKNALEWRGEVLLRAGTHCLRPRNEYLGGCLVTETLIFSHGLVQDDAAVFLRQVPVQVDLPTDTEPEELLAVYYYDEAAM